MEVWHSGGLLRPGNVEEVHNFLNIRTLHALARSHVITRLAFPGHTTRRWEARPPTYRCISAYEHSYAHAFVHPSIHTYIHAYTYKHTRYRLGAGDEGNRKNKKPISRSKLTSY
ncbi:hypothetical protein POVWA1_027890 [Plasmodium ovale wallikeri]|uniref:Uncharacterized protein n=1 Tax=Plasmodium ovale wallikeri TaxID=864142 RepID=A0A1A8YV87_PLAOA|nr:hypothetical protein POVWA1_027890 [Plasmodium ovale wallikeri]